MKSKAERRKIAALKRKRSRARKALASIPVVGRGQHRSIGPKRHSTFEQG